jgi:hypothetical protein
MNLLNKGFLTLGVLLAGFSGSLVGQSAYELTFQGILADIDGAGIGDESFMLKVQIRLHASGEVLHEFTSDAKTDREGWFGFTISSISGYMMNEDGSWRPILIRMEFLPDDQTSWIEKGNDFLVTYTLEPSKRSTSLFQMTRMEGSELEVYSEEHLHAFRDLYPFAYLTGGYLITDIPPADSVSVADLRQWLTPDPDDEGDASSRGVKGGFPMGGYRKKK